MTALRARAHGSDPELVDGDNLTDAERERLDDALEASWLSARDGTIDADDVMAELEGLEPAHG